MKSSKNKPTTLDASSISIENVECQDDNIELQGSNNPFNITMYLDQNSDDTYFKKFIKATEKVVRTNKDYNQYLTFLREERGLNSCTILHTVESGEALIELHHFPFTLFTICSIVANDLLAKNEKVSTFYLADKVIQEHFSENIGFVPLSTTIHELAHLGKITLLKKNIYGSYLSFFNKYNAFFTDKEKEFIDKLEVTKKINIDDNVISLLENK
jgi:hypothetical protein